MHSISLNFQFGDPTSLHPHLTTYHLRSSCLSKLLFECLTRINFEGETDMYLIFLAQLTLTPITKITPKTKGEL